MTRLSSGDEAQLGSGEVGYEVGRVLVIRVSVQEKVVAGTKV